MRDADALQALLRTASQRQVCQLSAAGRPQTRRPVPSLVKLALAFSFAFRLRSYTLLPAAVYEKMDEEWSEALNAAAREAFGDSSPEDARKIHALNSTAKRQAAFSALEKRSGDDRAAMEEDVAIALRATVAGERHTARELSQALLRAADSTGVHVQGSLLFTGTPQTLFFLLGMARLRCSSAAVFAAASALLSERRREEVEYVHLPLLSVTVSNLFVGSVSGQDALCFAEALGFLVLEVSKAQTPPAPSCLQRKAREAFAWR